MKDKWIQLKGIGALYMEKVLVFFDMPLMFVCTDSFNHRFTVLCINEETHEYIAIQADTELLIKMLRNAIPMRSLFTGSLNNKIMRIYYNRDKRSFDYKYEIVSNIPDYDLPDKEAYFDISNKMIDEYINFLINEPKEIWETFKCIMYHFPIKKMLYYISEEDSYEDNSYSLIFENTCKTVLTG